MTAERLKEWEMRIKESFLYHLSPRDDGESSMPKPCALFRDMLEEAGVVIDRGNNG
jgi:hypothetical protein